ncbi:MAG TPA: M20/M25/M40 family metallo-hydrolase [Candidatus Angelobacter sp.]|nr:M20/M25/M40 family metallo-hydrolase [Candidatus Angelobacter sp.]
MALGPQQRPSISRLTSSDAEGSRPQLTAQQVVARLAELRGVHEAFAWFRAHARQLEDLQLELTAIPAPPWGEAVRSEWMRSHFEASGLAEVQQDELGNVFGVLPGTDAEARFVALSAHLDTVFPAGTPIQVIREGGKLFGPGISDNGAGLTALLAIASGLRESGIEHTAPILFIGNVGEEGEGNLRGIRHIFEQPQWLQSIDALVVLDGAGTDTVIAEGLGSRRYEVTVRGTGGHSWSDFGIPNPVVALAKIIDRFSKTTVPSSPKTTFNVGTVAGGTSVNSIPQSATMRVDTRSASVEQLDRLEKALREAVKDGTAETGGRKKLEALRAEVRLIGDRPAADLPSDARLLKAIRAVDAQLNNHARMQRASTDANIPLSLGREAIAIGAGGSGGGAHTMNEWYDSAGRDLGLKRILLLTLALSGVLEE